jgi:hypothetical protein
LTEELGITGPLSEIEKRDIQNDKSLAKPEEGDGSRWSYLLPDP